MRTRAVINRRVATAICLALATLPAAAADGEKLTVIRDNDGQSKSNLNVADESPAEAKVRHRRVAERRARIHIICHRGAVEFAHENTLEAFRAAFELGADGNEIDIRATKDGVLVCFHDDMLDHLLEAYGDVADYTWDKLSRFRFRNPRPFGKHCHIPTLAEVFELHRRHAGLLHLDIKRPEQTKAVMRLLDQMDMWDHVVQAPAGVDDRRVKRGRYKASLYSDRSEVDAAAIAAALVKPGNSLMVEDPRGVAVVLGRKFRRPSKDPVASIHSAKCRAVERAPRAELLDVLRDVEDWNQVAMGKEAEAKSAARIVRRAEAADSLARLGVKSDEAIKLLRQRVRQRSLHRHWRYQGLDGAAALRALVRLKAPQTVELARYCLWRDDPAIQPVVNPKWNNPRSWTDWRTKVIVLPELAHVPGGGTERLCRDYLDLTDEAARKIGVPQFEAAARTLLAVNSTKATAVELLKHRRSDVRGRAILFCLSHAHVRWTEEALSTAAPHALTYRLPAPNGRDGRDE